LDFLIDRLIENSEAVSDPTVRMAYGRLSGVVGIFSNLLLFAMKLAAGLAAGAISVVADGLNNLTDAISSVVTLVGFHISGQKADEEHPFGHGRVEYVTGLLVSLVIVLVGVELLKTSIGRIIEPQAAAFAPLTLGILALSVVLKLLQYRFNHRLSVRIESASLKATAQDSLSDAAATAVIFVGGLVAVGSGLHIDGWLGVFVSLFILRAGFLSAGDTLNPLLGSRPSRALVEEISATVLAHEEILGVHDLIIHDYGPGRSMMSLHAEVSHESDILIIHDLIDDIERELALRFHTVAVIHMDPIVTGDAQVDEMRAQIAALVREVDEGLTIHDFRMTAGALHTNLIFDIAVPFRVTLRDDEIGELVREKISRLPGKFYTVIEIDRVFFE